MGIFTLIFLLPFICIALAWPALWHGRKPWNFLRGLLVAVAGVAVPLFFFFASALVMFAWKGACPCGWVDGFLIGKVALTPIVLFATASLYWVEVWVPGELERPLWTRLGLYCGAITSAGCLLYGFLCLLRNGAGGLALLGPLCYIPAWYLWRALQQPASPTHYLWATAAITPFWAGAFVWARRVFDALPSQQPNDCFVVTAATHGHQRLVGPFLTIERRGVSRRVNPQLLLFWQFENAWRERYPRLHGSCRRLYNCVGPQVARRVRSRWSADVVYLMLKPLEWLIRVTLKLPHDGN